jgi:autotransporter-associated beta strand protein
MRLESTWRGWINGLALTHRGRATGFVFLAVAAVLAAQPAAGVVIDVSGGGNVNKAILGQYTGLGQGGDTGPIWELSYNSSVRGVAGGSNAETYNWEDRSGFNCDSHNYHDTTTLTFLESVRDHGTSPLFTANCRGTGVYNSGNPYGWNYTDMSQATVAKLAAEWVRYTNYILPTYRQGDTITTSGPGVVDSDQAILNKLSFGTNYKLLSRREAAVPKVVNWEIGNEPEEYSDGGPPNPYYSMTPAEYHDRYRALTAAMRAQDLTIKVGPDCSSASAHMDAVLADHSLPVDFVSYHPYAGHDLVDAATLRALKATTNSRRQDVINYLAANGRPTNTPLIASEWNPGFAAGPYEDFNTTAHALGVAETVFTFAEEGLAGANYCQRPAYEFTELPAYKMFQALQNHMGDKLVSSWYDGNADSSNHRVYVTKDTATGKVVVWGLNFSNTTDAAANLNLQNLGFNTTSGVLKTLEWDPAAVAAYGPTNLTCPYPVPEGDRVLEKEYINWHSSQLTGLNTSNLSFALPHAKVVALILPQPRYWNGVSASNWYGAQWAGSSSGPFTSAWTDHQLATFTKTGGGSYSITVNGSPTVGGLSFGDANYTLTGGTVTLDDASYIDTASGRTATINSVLAGTGDVLKTGTGTLTLGGASSNTMSGSITVQAGTLQLSKTGGAVALAGNVLLLGTDCTTAGGNYNTLSLGGDNQIASTATVSFNPATGNYPVFNLNNHSQTVAGISDYTGRGYIQNTQGTGSTGTLTVNNAADCTFNGRIQDSHSGVSHLALVKDGPGTLTLGGTNTFSGGLTIKGGTLCADFTQTTAPATNILPNTAGMSLNLAGGTVQVKFKSGAGNTQTVAGTTVSAGASGVIANNAAGTLYLNAISRSRGGTVDFSTADSAAIRTTTANANPSGDQQSILGGYATYGGNTWAVSGTGATAGAIIGLSTFQTTFAGTNDVDAPATISTIANNLTINSLRFNNSTAASTVNINSDKTLTVATGGILETSTVGANAVAISGGNLTSGNGQDLVVHQNNTAAAMTIASQITGSNSGLTKSGAGTLILGDALSGVNSFSGPVNVNAGMLQMGNDSALGNAGNAITVHRGALLDVESTHPTCNVTINGTYVDDPRYVNDSGHDYGALGTVGWTAQGGSSSLNVALGSDSTIGVRGAGWLSVGTISGSGNLTKVGSGQMGLNGTATYTGSTTIADGNVYLNSGAHLPSRTNVTMYNTTALLSLNGNTQTIGSLSGGGASGGNIGLGSSGALTFGNGDSTTYAGGIGGAGQLIKQGAGSTTFTGVNTYTGATTINAGALRLDDAGAIGSTSGITLKTGGTLLQDSSTPLNRPITFNGGTLGGVGTYAGSLNVGNGRLSPGDGGIGTLTVQGGIDLGAASFLDFDFGPTAGSCDSIQLSGTLDLDGTMNIDCTGTLLAGRYTVFSGASSVTEHNPGHSLLFGDVPSGYAYSYDVHAGIVSVIVTAVPEPSGCVLLATALIGVLVWAWKK